MLHTNGKALESVSGGENCPGASESVHYPIPRPDGALEQVFIQRDRFLCTVSKLLVRIRSDNVGVNCGDLFFTLNSVQAPLGLAARALIRQGHPAGVTLVVSQRSAEDIPARFLHEELQLREVFNVAENVSVGLRLCDVKGVLAPAGLRFAFAAIFFNLAASHEQNPGFITVIVVMLDRGQFAPSVVKILSAHAVRRVGENYIKLFHPLRLGHPDEAV